MATEQTSTYPKDFEKAWTSWNEETKKKAACVGWAITMETALEIIKILRKKRDNDGGQE